METAPDFKTFVFALTKVYLGPSPKINTKLLLKSSPVGYSFLNLFPLYALQIWVDKGDIMKSCPRVTKLIFEGDSA